MEFSSTKIVAFVEVNTEGVLSANNYFTPSSFIHPTDKIAWLICLDYRAQLDHPILLLLIHVINKVSHKSLE